jgi:hypothetical protein
LSLHYNVLFQVLYCAYTLSLICRKGPSNFLYLSPDGMVPTTVYWSYILGNCGNIAWVFLWDRQMFTASGVVLALSALFLLISTGASMRGLYMTTTELRETKSTKKEIWLNRILVQNSLGMYATWLCIATLLNFGIILCYVLGVPRDISGTVCLGILAADLVIWFVVDIFVVYRASNYVVVPYIVVIVALAGSIEKNYVAMATNSVFSVVLIIVGSGALLVKVITMLWRHVHMLRDDDDDESDTDSSKMST